MKKAKIVLSAVALFALVGGAFAFKATRTNHTLYSYTAGGCISPTSLPYTTVNEGLGTTALTTVYTISLPGRTCPATTLFRAQ
ncbi:hypothetical protein [Chitinophaga pinensis]|uniref:Uncharacterized protein n=1 Tax=Chitinophaga pinensis TaxID=79329 RepID=A0A5C6LMF7_9BACT|nr:hypothetical protein [Chitinophaga pinensis]TWV96184.1 hypothetical protein FEF09_23640 [Chitinophaga pinensis]